MKHTRYILYGKPLDFDGIGIIALPAAVMAIPLLAGFLCGAVVMDGGRMVKLRYLLFKREQQKLNYIKCVLRSLDCEVTRENIEMLNAA
jgi:hypothetical protein